MNCFVINALCLADRNISKYGAPGEEVTHCKGIFGDTKREGCHYPARRAVLVLTLVFELELRAWHCACRRS